MASQSLVADVFTVLDLAHALRRVLDAHAQETTGLTLEQCVALYHIEQSASEMTITELAAAVSRANHTVTALVDKLAREGLVVRRRDPARDRRLVLVNITPEGTAKTRAFSEMCGEFLDQRFTGRKGRSARSRIPQIIDALGHVAGI